MEFNVKDAAQRLSGNADFINIMRVVCKASGWNTVLPDRTPTTTTTVNSNGDKVEQVVMETVTAEMHIKYNGKREVWHQVKNMLDLSDNTMAKIEYGIAKGEKIK